MTFIKFIVNPLDSKGNYIATSNNTKLVHWPLMGGPLHLVPNVTAHPSTASVLITVLRYDGPLLCDFNVVIKGLTMPRRCVNVVVESFAKQ